MRRPREPRNLPFDDRRDAGRRLASLLSALRAQEPLVLAVPCGGVPVAYEIGRHLSSPVDVLVVRPLGIPGRSARAMGAIATGGIRVMYPRVLESLDIEPEVLQRALAREDRELRRLERIYRGNRGPIPVGGRTAILVDDGLAGVATLRAAALSLRRRGPRQIIAAVPVGAKESCAQLSRVVDRMVCLRQPEGFRRVSDWYRDYPRVSHEEVQRMLGSRTRARAPGRIVRREVTVEAGGVTLEARLSVPNGAVGVVVFVRDSGDARGDLRSRFVARELEVADIGTLLIDLLTPIELRIDTRARMLRFDVGLLAKRLVGAIDWVATHFEPREHRVGLVGGGAGAAAALVAATARPSHVGAVVSRGGPPERADGALGAVGAPTLMLVGGLDRSAIEECEAARARMRGPATVSVIEHASELLEEPGALEEAARRATDFFRANLGRPTGSPRQLPPPPKRRGRSGRAREWR